MSHIYNGAEIKAHTFNSEKTQKRYLNGELYWSAGSVVTYVVDSGVFYTEEVDSGASCLSPKKFTPSKSGWTFVGWREDTIANASVLSSKVMDSEPITLYAVFNQTVTGTFVSYDSTQKADGTRYYNNGNTRNAQLTAPTGRTYTGWTWRGWASSGNTSAAASVTYANSASITGVTANFTVYGLYQQTITLSYNGNGATGGSVGNQTGTRYHNSAGNYSNPSFTLASNGFTRSGYNFNGWNLGAVGASITLSANATAYAQWSMVSILVSGVWQSSASSVDNGVMSYNSEGYLAASVSTKDGTTSYTGPSFSVDTTGLSKISFMVYLTGDHSTDANGEHRITFTVGSQSVTYEHPSEDAATTQTLSIDVSSMSGVQKCTCTMVEDCRQEDDEWGWSSNHTVRLLNITPT